MHALVFSAIISTLPIEGAVTEKDGDYVRVPFVVPEGTVEIHFRHSYEPKNNVLDFGMLDPAGQRGWCGGLTDPDIIGEAESSRCYLPGTITPGEWLVDIGLARVDSDVVNYSIVLEFHDAPTLEPRPRAGYTPRVLEEGARWYAGDFHVHSTESGDASATFDQIYSVARSRGLDWVNLSDHNTVTQHSLMAAFQESVDDLLFLRGSEVTTYAGHGNTVGNASYIDHHIGVDGHTIQGLLQQVEDDGAIFIVNHPVLSLGDACIGCAWEHEDTPWDKVAGIEIHTAYYALVPIFGRPALAMWDRLLDEGHRITGVSGSDDHRAEVDPAPNESKIGEPTTLVWASDLSEAALMEGVRAGRAVVKLRGPDDPMLELFAQAGDGERGMIGDTVTGAAVTLEAHAVGASGMVLQLVRNGVIDESVTVDSDDFTATFERDVREEGDRYRVHLAESYDVVITNHVWVEYAPAAGGEDAGPDAGNQAEGDDDDDGCGCRAAGDGAAGTGLLALLALLGLRRRPRSRR